MYLVIEGQEKCACEALILETKKPWAGKMGEREKKVKIK